MNDITTLCVRLPKEDKDNLMKYAENHDLSASQIIRQLIRNYLFRSNGAAYTVHYIYDLIGSNLEVREGVLSGDCTENNGENLSWFLVDERADFSYTDHRLISAEEAKHRIELYQQSVVHQFDGFISFAEYADELDN